MRRLKHGYCVSLAAAFVLAGAAAAARAEQPISISGGAQKAVSYACDNGDSLDVTYVNATSDSLAIVPVEGTRRVFANVLSGSGARYASGVYIWWSKAKDAALYDLRHGPDGPAIAQCHEAD